jgi:hypothetical protein
MNPVDLVRYREHAWSRTHNRDGLSAWDRLRDEVERDGFREPAFLEYNPQTGEAYLGEGNHRLGIAIELGIPLPVVVHRTTKTAPDHGMKPLTEPGRYLMRDDRGFSRFPECVRPEDIGLPTVTWERARASRDSPDQQSERSNNAGFEL